MRKISVILLSLCIFFQMNVKATSEHDITLLMETIADFDIEVAEWEVTHIVKMSREEAKQILLHMEGEYVIVKEVKDQSTTYNGQPKNKLASIDQQIRIVEQAGKSTLQMTLSSNQWNEQVEQYYKLLTTSLQNDVNLNEIRSYTCVKVSDSDIIINGLLNDEFWSKLKVVHKSEQKETLQHSLYEKEIIGYTPLFQQEMIVNNDAINMQMMIKNTRKNKKQLIIGTPVILNEY